MQTEGPGDLVNQATLVLTDFMVYTEMKRAFGDDEPAGITEHFAYLLISEWIN